MAGFVQCDRTVPYRSTRGMVQRLSNFDEEGYRFRCVPKILGTGDIEFALEPFTVVARCFAPDCFGNMADIQLLEEMGK